MVGWSNSFDQQRYPKEPALTIRATTGKAKAASEQKLLAG